MVVNELASGRFNNSAAVGSGVVGLAFAKSYTLSHCEILRSKAEYE